MNSPVYHIAIAPPSIQLLRMKTCTSTFYNRLQTGPPPSHTYLCYNLSPEIKGIVLKISPFTALSTQNLVSFLIGKSKSPAWPLKPSTMWLWSPSPTSFPTHHSFHVHCTAVTQACLCTSDTLNTSPSQDLCTYWAPPQNYFLQKIYKALPSLFQCQFLI